MSYHLNKVIFTVRPSNQNLCGFVLSKNLWVFVPISVTFAFGEVDGFLPSSTVAYVTHYDKAEDGLFIGLRH